MKQYFYFYFDNSGTLCCVNEYKFQEHHYKNSQALKFLNIANHLNFKKIILKDNSMYLKSNNNSVIIDDIDTFWRKKYYHFLPNVKAILDNSMRYNLLKDDSYAGMSVNNMTFLAKPYKQKIAIKGGSVVLYAGAVLSLTSLLSNSIDRTIDVPATNITSIDNESERVINPETLAQEQEYVNEYVEREKARQEEYNQRYYFNFTSYTEETKEAYDKFYNIVYANCKQTGIDPNLVMAMLIQESHGKLDNLMQINYSDWKGYVFNYYDFECDEYKKFVLTDNKDAYEDDVECVSYDEFLIGENNIKAGCLILRESIKYTNNNIMAGVQCYNLGTGNMNSVLRHTSADLNISKDELLADQDNLAFTNYTKYASGGDKHYINNVSRYLNDTDYIYYLDIDEDGNITEYKHDLVKEKEKVLTIDK